MYDPNQDVPVIRRSNQKARDTVIINRTKKMICTIVGKTKGKTRNSLMTQKIDITILRFTRNYMDDEKQKAVGGGGGIGPIHSTVPLKQVNIYTEYHQC